jgi:hypothetical protein
MSIEPEGNGKSRNIEGIKKTDKETPEFSASVVMPPAIGIEEKSVEYRSERLSICGKIPVVHMQGIDHIIIGQDNEFYSLRDLSDTAEQLIRQLCAKWGSECLGMMFCHDSEDGRGSENENSCDTVSSESFCKQYSLIPLVYVPGADTIFWENSCASGTAAAGMYYAAEAGAPIDVSFEEPAGSLRVQSDPVSNRTVLTGRAILTAQDTLKNS